MSQKFCARSVLAAIAFALLSTSAAAQTASIVDPRTVEFDPSLDHSAMGTDGQPIVIRYELELYVVGGVQPVQVANLGKPGPQTDGKIRVDFSTLLSPWPAAGTVYEARVAAVGPNGVGRSNESNTFAFSSLCSSSVTPTSVSLAGAASTGSVAVSAVSGCAWSASSSASWITITAGASGTGNGTVSYSVTANTTSTQRTGSMSIAGHTFTIVQAGGCTFTISPGATSVSAAAASGSVAVSAMAGCAWTATSGASWITVTSGATGNGNGSVGYSIAANTTTTARTGTVTIAGRTFTVTQEAASCTFTLSSVGATLGSSASSGAVGVTAATGCAWTATSGATWITVTGGASGSGNGQVAYSVTANPSTSQRSGTITIAGQTFTVTQAGQACTFALAPVSASVPAAATTGTVSVDTLTGCSWSASTSASWLTITSGSSGSGDGTINFSVAANTSLTPRTGTIIVGTDTVTVTQAGVVCTATIAPTGASVAASGAQGSVTVTLPNGCSWTATSSAAWLTVNSGGSGSGSGTVAYTVAPNTSTSARSATLSIAGQTYTVSQAGITCSYTVSPTTAAATSGAGTGSVTVTAAAGCAWTAASSVSWITVTSGSSGAGPGSVSYSYVANPTTQARSGVLTVAGQAVSVTQAAGCGYSISPASASVTAAAGSGTVNVTAGSTCAWTAQSGASWITFTTAASGTGNAAVGYAVASNPNSSSRSATITVAGQPFVVTQAGAACDASLTPTTQSISAAGGTGSVGITVPGGCTWSAVPSVSWITVTNGGTGSGSGTVAYQIEANAAGTVRTGTIAIAGRLLTVTQGAASCTASLSSTADSLEATGGSRVVSVTIPVGCVWTAFSNATWLTVTSGGGPNNGGSGAVTYLAAANTSSSPRTGTLTISGRTFTVSQAGTCDIGISPSGVSANADASTGTVSVTAGAACSWSATSTASWLTVDTGATGTGSGSVGYSVAANTTNAARTGTLSIGGRVFSVTQAAPTCAVVLSTTSVSLTAASAFRTFQVSTASGCAWTASSSVPWITISIGSTGTGSGSVFYSVTANTGTASRTGTITVGGETVTVTQGGAACTYSLAPLSVTLSAVGTSASVAVTTSADCAWTVSSGASWLTVTSPTSGQGDGTVQYTAAPNPTSTSRVGTLTIGSRAFNVTQAGIVCTNTLSSNSVTVGSPASTLSVIVATGDDCAWTASSPVSWITIPSGSGGTGPSTVSIAVAENTGATSRSAMLSIAGRSLTVTQSADCDYSVTQTSIAVPGTNSLTSISIRTGAGCAWTTQSPVSWATINSASGSGNWTVSVSVTANPTTSPRTATLTIAGEAVLLTQAGVTCNYLVSPTSVSLTSGSSVGISIVAPTGCAWTATANVSWITFGTAGSGSGNGTLRPTFAPNTSTSSRSGVITVAGWRVFVTQGPGGGVPPSAPTGMRLVTQN